MAISANLDGPHRPPPCGANDTNRSLATGDAMPQPNGEPDDENALPRTRIAYTSAELFRGRKEIFIEHEQETYCLRITSKDKLLLTK